ncbi:mucin-associated surface protein (MASP) [Trypanosoma cruzi Dm28c]|uniref:Mucin-associated surface protein (MASP) n=2 Tax=Trypanosoma cruzi TaxID=5693 RepID=V5BCM6_TRYCR|nr:mucin-associated surface protein (MASP) [Trypanosoma cruzi Dm28c]
MIMFCFTCFRCSAVCSVLLFPASVTLNASRTNSYSWHAHDCLRGTTFEDGCMLTGAILYSPLFFLCVLLHFFLYCCLFTCVLFLIASHVFSVYLLRGVVCVFALSLIPTDSLYVHWWAAICYCAWLCGVAVVSFFSFCCVDVLLVCAEGYTQVTGVMAMMMTGRVLLVCALCVLWCGAGGKCDEVVRAPAGSAGDESEPLVQSPELGTSSKGSKELEDAAPVVKRESPPAPPTPSDGEDDDERDGDGQEDGSPSEKLEEHLEDGPGKQKTKSPLQKKEQELRQPPQAQVNVQQQPQPPPQQPQPPSAPQPKPSASEKSEGVGENSRGGAVQSSLGAEDNGNEDPENPKEDSLKDLSTKSENSEQVQTTVQKTVPPEHKTQKEVLTPEQKTNESQSTDTSTNLPEPQKENKEYPASTEGTAQSTSTGSQEQEAEPSTSEEPSPFEEHQSTGTKTTEDARTPDAAATEKRQSVNNYTTTPGDSDGSTAVSHTTSPLLLLVVVACAAAAAVVAA